MKTKEEIIEALRNEPIMKKIKSINYYSIESFYDDAIRYIEAIREQRMINTIGSVSSSGMSRTIKFVEISKNESTGCYNVLNFWSFFKALGYKEARNKDGYFSISGCGMDMIFHTNYTNIRDLYYYGFLTKEETDVLSQQTPRTI